MTDIVIKQKIRHGFRCVTCGQVDVYDSAFAAPVHCGVSMQSLGMQIASGGDVMEIALLKIDKERRPSGFFATEKEWPGHWNGAWELWRFQEGRNNGERIGWLGSKPTLLASYAWEFIMVPGCHVKEGSGASRLDVVTQMWGIINAG